MLKKRIQPGISFKNKGGKALGASPVWIEARASLHPVSLLPGPEHSLDSCQWPGVVDLDPRLPVASVEAYTKKLPEVLVALRL